MLLRIMACLSRRNAPISAVQHRVGTRPPPNQTAPRRSCGARAWRRATRPCWEGARRRRLLTATGACTESTQSHSSSISTTSRRPHRDQAPTEGQLQVPRLHPLPNGPLGARVSALSRRLLCVMRRQAAETVSRTRGPSQEIPAWTTAMLRRRHLVSFFPLLFN